MRLFLSIFLMFVMTTGFTVSIVKQWKDCATYEHKDSKSENSDDSNDNTNTDEEEVETKSQAEKALLSFKHPYWGFEIELAKVQQDMIGIRVLDDDLRNSLYALLPDNPPEA